MAYHVLSFSGGKDSTALLFLILEKGLPLDEVLFYDTGLEFPAMYDHINMVRSRLPSHLKFTVLFPDESFEYKAFYKVRHKRDGSSVVGYSFPGPHCRWCTGDKIKISNKYLDELRLLHGSVYLYLGIAFDESYRLHRPNNIDEYKLFPLVDFQFTEQMCLDYCYDLGFSWNGLYNFFSRVSCWCCPLQSLNNLKCLYLHFPDLWGKLKYWESISRNQFRLDYSIAELESKFYLDSIQINIFDSEVL